MSDKTKARERATGRYSFDGNWDRLCVCGHKLAVHLAEAPHDCDSASHHGPACDCPKFRPARGKQ